VLLVLVVFLVVFQVQATPRAGLALAGGFAALLVLGVAAAARRRTRAGRAAAAIPVGAAAVR